MMEVVTSANVACGFHAGDPSVLRAACVRAVECNVAIGAQVSYPDLLGFGRRHLDMAPAELRDAVLYQLGALDAFAQVGGSEIAYVKPHGALYHAVATDPALAQAVIDAAAEYDSSLAILGLPDSELLRAADRRDSMPSPKPSPTAPDRPDGGWCLDGSRERLTDPDEVAQRAVRIAIDNEVVATDGTVVSVRARSICVHSDTPGAVQLARAVRVGTRRCRCRRLPFHRLDPPPWREIEGQMTDAPAHRPFVRRRQPHHGAARFLARLRRRRIRGRPRSATWRHSSPTRRSRSSSRTANGIRLNRAAQIASATRADRHIEGD